MNSMVDIMRERSQRHVRVRWLMLEDFQPRAPAALRTWDPRPEIRTIHYVPADLMYSEKAALVVFRKLDGKLAYDSLVGEDTATRSWVRDLFAYGWERARPWSF